MERILASLVIVCFTQLLSSVSSYDHQRYFVPTQEHFISQQSHGLLHDRGQGVLPNSPFGWASRPGGQNNFGGNDVLSSASANAASGVSFGFPKPQFPQSSQLPPQQTGLQFPPQFFGGTFGLGFGFGGGWYNQYPLNPFPITSTNIQQQQQHFQQQQQHFQQQHFQQSSSATASASTGLQFNKPNDLQLTYPLIPTILRPSQTGWDTSYNVPCGTYQINPFVVANLRLGTSFSPFSGTNGRRKRRSPFNFPFGQSETTDEQYSSHQFQHERGLPSYFPPAGQFANPNPGQSQLNQPKICSWNFNSDGTCKLKFKCLWFQLPALLSCSENYMIVTDTTPNLNNTFCGNRKPRKVYNSSNGKLILTFRSHATSLPAVFDCAVTCSLESTSNEHKPESTLILAALTKDDNNFTTSTENDSTFSASTSGKDNSKLVEVAAGGPDEKPQIRIGDCRCGVENDHYLSKGRVVGGSPATPTEFSWTVALVRKSSSFSSVSRSVRPFCGGSLISDRYVITAAHCVSNNKIIREPRSSGGVGSTNPKEIFDVLLIEHDVTRLDDVPGGNMRTGVDKIVVHPRYNNVSFDYDVALIRLERPIEFTSQPSFYRYDTFDFHSRRRFIPEVEARPLLPRPTPICLPSDKGESLVDKYATITGWGLTDEGGMPSDELLKATVQIFNDSLCKEIYKEYNYPVTNTMMCAGFLAGKVDACVGDSGGGLIVKENEKYVIAGITSWGRGCGRKKQPGVYTKIPALIEWIRKEASDGIWCV